MKDFDSKREGQHGTLEWAETNFNIQVGCKNNCLYCYAAHNAARFGRRDRADWAKEEITNKANIRSYPHREGVVMFPSTHDFNMDNVHTCSKIARLILQAKNSLLLVTKPDKEAVRLLCHHLSAWKDKILWRFTITSMDSQISKFWEPGASEPQERLDALAIAYHAGFKTSVSAEPLLGGFEEAKEIVEATEDLVTDTIWIGLLNKPRIRVPHKGQYSILASIKEIESRQSKAEITRLVNYFTINPKIRWKDSITNLLLGDK